MGVPGFFSWLIRNYKERRFIVQSLPKKAKVLYIDSNCLFHPQCFKILDNYPNVKNLDKLEDYMFRRIQNYITYLVEFADPEIVYISVDGVAPLAKISQQRKRRFKSIEDNAAKEAIKKKYNIESNDIWSNTKITPGTEFMEKLHKKLCTYIENKIKAKNNKRDYIYSSYHTIGEGEHKILDDIRERTKTEPNKDDAYVVYGLDADLFFLSMASQKENIFLLREASQLDNKPGKTELYDPIDDVAEELKYVSIDLTKACYNNTIIKILEKKLETYDMPEEEKQKVNLKNKKFINDFIFLCYLLGNDFLPHFSSIDIKKNGLDFLLDCYSDVYLKTQLNLISLQKGKVKINYIVLTEILRICSLKESYYFAKLLPEYLEMYKKKRCPHDDDYHKEVWELDNIKNIEVEDKIQLGVGKPEEWKFRYYKHYFGELPEYNMSECKNIRDESCKKLVVDMCKNYLEGLEWVTQYYFLGCPSWTWQYKFSHAPFVSDLYFYLKNNFFEVKFKKDSPLSPCMQLLSVLPPACHKELPKNYQHLVLDKNSPIKDMFPESEDIKTDYIYKELLWQCIPMIPYLNVDRIKEECSKYKLSKNEEVLNKISDPLIYKCVK